MDDEVLLRDRMDKEPDVLVTEVMERWRFAHLERPSTPEEGNRLARSAQADIALLYNLYVGKGS